MTTPPEITSWQKAWRDGFVPLLSRKGLRSLLEALERDDDQLLQGQTCDPPPIACNDQFAVEACCPIAWAACGGAPQSYTVADLEWEFARVCIEASFRLGEEAACRYLLNWIDETPRAEMRREFIAEIKLALDDQARPAA